MVMWGVLEGKFYQCMDVNSTFAAVFIYRANGISRASSMTVLHTMCSEFVLKRIHDWKND